MTAFICPSFLHCGRRDSFLAISVIIRCGTDFFAHAIFSPALCFTNKQRKCVCEGDI